MDLVASEVDKPDISQPATETVAVAVVPSDSVCDMGKIPVISVIVNVDFMSKYVWRGIVFNKKPVLQPSLTLGYGAVSLNFWSNMDMTDQNGYSNKFNELDFTFDYSSSLSSLEYSAGMDKFTFPNTGFNSTTEMYLSLSSEKTGDASVTVYQDIDQCEGTYISLGNGTSIHLGNLTSLDVGVSINWGSAKHNNFYYGVDNSAVTDCSFSISATFDLWRFISLTPSIAYSALMNSSIRQAFKANDIERDTLFGGIGAGVSF